MDTPCHAQGTFRTGIHAHSALPIMECFCMNALFSPIIFKALSGLCVVDFFFYSIGFFPFRMFNQNSNNNYYHSGGHRQPMTTQAISFVL